MLVTPAKQHNRHASGSHHTNIAKMSLELLTQATGAIPIAGPAILQERKLPRNRKTTRSNSIGGPTEDESDAERTVKSKSASYGLLPEEDEKNLSLAEAKQIVERETEYRRKGFCAVKAATGDPFAAINPEELSATIDSDAKIVEIASESMESAQQRTELAVKFVPRRRIAHCFAGAKI